LQILNKSGDRYEAIAVSYASLGLFLRPQEFFEIEIEKPKKELFTPVGYQDRNNSQIMIKLWFFLQYQHIVDILR